MDVGVSCVLHLVKYAAVGVVLLWATRKVGKRRARIMSSFVAIQIPGLAYAEGRCLGRFCEIGCRCHHRAPLQMAGPLGK
jgi:hypothetical protein